MAVLQLPLDNDFEPEVTIKKKDPATGAKVPVTGLTTADMWISLTKSGPSLDNLTKKDALERGVAAPGKYYCIMDGDDLRTVLAARVGQTIYLVLSDAGNILAWVAYKVVATRSM